MKKPALFLFAMAVALSASGSEMVVKFIEPIKLVERESLPPALMATFSVACNQSFLKVIRQEITVPTSTLGKMIISIGGLVSEDVSKICEAREEITVPAGHTFSGREYDVQTILKQ